MPINIESIRQKVLDYLNDPLNEDEIAEAIALEVSRGMAPLIAQGMAGDVMPPQEPEDDNPQRHADPPPGDPREPAGELGTPSPDFDHRPPRG